MLLRVEMGAGGDLLTHRPWVLQRDKRGQKREIEYEATVALS